MRKRILSSLIAILVVVFIAVIISNNNSFAVSSDFTSLSMYSDRHVKSGEKVFVKIDGNASEIKSLSIDLKSGQKIVSVDVESISYKPYFVLPVGEYSDGDIYKINEIRTVLSDNKEHSYKINDGSYIQIDNSDDVAWRDFNGFVLTNNQADYRGNYYFNLIADTKDIVSITVNLMGTSDYISYVENIDTRPFFSIDKIGEYSIKNITVYYKDGNSFTYDAIDKNSVSYLKIDNNSIIVNYLDIDDASKNLEEKDYETTNNATNVGSYDSANYTWIFFLFIMVLAAVVLFYMIKNEE